jgi:hypothetical protein
MDGLIIAGLLGASGIAVAVLDQQNILPFSNNPRKLWFWDPVRYQPVPARLPIRPVLLTEQQLIRNAEQERLWEMEQSRRQSKYVVTDTSVPATKFEPYRK